RFFFQAEDGIRDKLVTGVQTCALPISEDTAAIAIEAAAAPGNVTVDAAGPESYSFDELVRLVGSAVGHRRSLVHAPPRLALALRSEERRVGKGCREWWARDRAKNNSST